MKSENGLFVSWKELNEIANKIDQLLSIIIVASRDSKNLHRYEDDQEMYETCDIVIEMIDSYFWEVFSKDYEFIDRLATKFKEIEFAIQRFPVIARNF